jgi:DNA invertase Pin-like site-specific DNA recombinase
MQLARDRGLQVVETLDVSRARVRPALEELRQRAHQSRFDALVVDTVGFPGIGVMGMLHELDVLGQIGIEIVSRQEAWLSTSGVQGHLISWVVSRAGQEHRERIRMALAHVRAEGRSLGRPRASIPVDKVLAMRSEGASLRQIARAVGLGAATVHRFLVAHDQVAKSRKSEGR